VTITGRAGLVFIELLIEEAMAAKLDQELLVLPLEDAFATEEELADAIAEAGEG
jgi:hypothetical protein